MLNLTAAILLTFLTLYNVYAQDISLQSQVDKNIVTLGDQLVFQVTVTGNVSDIPQPNLPELTGFTAYSSGRSQNISIVNGQVSSAVSFNYVLVPKSVGKYTIGPATINYRSQTYKTNPIDVEVVSGQQTPVGTSQKSTPSPGKSKGGGQLAFITTSVDKNKVYVNDGVTLSFRFYRRVRLLAQPQYNPPSTTGFWTEDLPPQREFQETVDGQTYLVTEIKTALFPTSAGKFTVGTAQLQCTVEDFSPDTRFNDDFFRSFFSQGKTQVLKSNPIEITVLPLPTENKPSDFAGSVGSYQIKASLDKSEVKLNEPVTLTVEVSGTGNIKTINQPSLIKLTNMRKYETVSSLNINKQGYVVRGSKVFKTVLVPQTVGKTVIPEIQFTFFDPGIRTYRTVRSGLLNLNVLPGTLIPTTGVNVFPSVGSMVKIIGTDVRFIKLGLKKNLPGRRLYQAPVLLYICILCLGLPIFSGYYRVQQEKLAGDLVFARYSRAVKKVRRLVLKLNRLSKTCTPVVFTASIHDILVGYLADKLNLSAAGLTINTVKDCLQEKKVDLGLIDKIVNLWEEADFVRFAPEKNSTVIAEERTRELMDLVNRLEKSL